MTAATPLAEVADVQTELVRKAPSKKRKLPVLPVARLLEEQRTLTAVERFARRHDEGSIAKTSLYRDIFPLANPGPGEQFAFEVDLDRCTGCKACVTACHTLNGLDEGEVWRTVGLLHGGTASAPVVQTVTTSCHHCVEPACLLGCPTKAYEKDAATGIVRHLDDQCFGCEYCIMMCPYDAPKYNASKGIVRKCDMCSDRLAHGEAPACVQACPSGAIAIRVVAHAATVAAADAGMFLPGVAPPERTLPTTVYKTSKAAPNDLLPADFHRANAERGHPPLVVMLTLMQMSAGAFAVEFSIERLESGAAHSAIQAFAAVLAVVALGASALHLGRPWLAWRAVLGWRTSWLSREALVFGMYVSLVVLQAWGGAARLSGATATLGVVGIFCSVMVYVATRRAPWSSLQTGVRFFGTALSLGSASSLALRVFTDEKSAVDRAAPLLCGCVLVATILKLVAELAILRHRSDTLHSPSKRMAIVMLGELRTVTLLRFACALVAGGAWPVVLLCAGHVGIGGTAFMLALLFTAELMERYLFFAAAPPSRMPGGLR